MLQNDGTNGDIEKSGRRDVLVCEMDELAGRANKKTKNMKCSLRDTI